MNSEIIEVVSCFKCLGSYFSKDESPQEDVKMKMDEGLETFSTSQMMFNVCSVSLVERLELYERVLVQTVSNGRKLRV